MSKRFLKSVIIMIIINLILLMETCGFVWGMQHGLIETLNDTDLITFGVRHSLHQHDERVAREYPHVRPIPISWRSESHIETMRESYRGYVNKNRRDIIRNWLNTCEPCISYIQNEIARRENILVLDSEPEQPNIVVSQPLGIDPVYPEPEIHQKHYLARYIDYIGENPISIIASTIGLISGIIGIYDFYY